MGGKAEIVFPLQFKAFEQINRFALLEKSFKVGEELSAKQELKRHRINEIYKREIEELFS